MENKIIKKELALSLIDLNEGQIEGLPKNPREWTITDVERLAASIEETPELLDARGVIVYPYKGRYVAIGGNLRITALRHSGAKKIPCVVLPKCTMVEKLKEIAIKDNGSFGQWDEKLLMDDWSGMPFAEWGIDVFELSSDEKDEDKREVTKDDRNEFSIKLEAREFEFVNMRLREINSVPEQAFLSLIRGGEGDEEDE